jgi:outer membrane biosynthesis protein TonB
VVQHKQQVKEHLRAHLRHPLIPLRGQVRLQLWLDPAGGLRFLRVVEASDPALAQRAAEDARSAQPYPAFPRSLRASHLRYEYLVKYESQ